MANDRDIEAILIYYLQLSLPQRDTLLDIILKLSAAGGSPENQSHNGVAVQGVVQVQPGSVEEEEMDYS